MQVDPLRNWLVLAPIGTARGTAVSYTHLDVYKRQPDIDDGRMERHSGSQ